MIDYRAATPDDEPGIFAVWSASLRAPVAWLRRDWDADRRRHEHAFVAVDESGVLAVVLYIPRLLRDAAGVPVQVGGIGAVATRPDARRRGHARRLLGLAVAAMAEDGCGWSLLFGRAEIYRPLGWRTLPLRYGRARPTPPRRLPSGVRPGSIAQWKDLAPLYDAFNATRPLSAVRTAVEWEHGVGQRLGDLLIFERDGVIGGYAAVSNLGARPGPLELSELAVRDERAADHLLAAVACLGDLTLRLPADPLIDEAVARHFGRVEPGLIDYALARPITGPEATVTAEAAFWPADGF